jgi:hypothetical protein
MLYGVGLAAIPIVIRRGLGHAGRLAMLTLGVTLLYTAFLVFTYIAHFPGEIGASAHSFFRYNTHLGLLAMLAVVAFAREDWARRGAPRLGGGWRAIQIGAVILAALAPIPASAWIRPDLRFPQPLVWSIARFAAPSFQDGDHVALLLPGDNRSVAFMLRVAIAMTPPRRKLAHFDDIPRADEAALAVANADGNAFALISCVTPALAASPTGQSLKLPAGRAALLARAGAGWTLIGTQAYPGDLPPLKAWTAQLSPGPFCR